LFAGLVPDRAPISLAAISAAAADAAGPGWAAVHVADRPRDHALLELAARLCKTAGLKDGERDV
jgi:uroporphyrinogen-III synthase